MFNARQFRLVPAATQQQGSILELLPDDLNRFRTLQKADKQVQAALKLLWKWGRNSDDEELDYVLLDKLNTRCLYVIPMLLPQFLRSPASSVAILGQIRLSRHILGENRLNTDIRTDFRKFWWG